MRSHHENVSEMPQRQRYLGGNPLGKQVISRPLYIQSVKIGQVDRVAARFMREESPSSAGQDAG